MKRNAPSAGSTGLPTRFSAVEALAAALALSLAVVAGATALLYPVVTAVFLAGGVAAWLTNAVARRARVTRATPGPVLAVSVPFTDVRVEV